MHPSQIPSANAEGICATAKNKGSISRIFPVSEFLPDTCSIDYLRFRVYDVTT